MEKAPGICSDAITRVPMIVSWKGQLSEGIVKEELVEAVDVVTTLCSLAGLSAMATSDGKDLTPLLKGQSEPVHDIAVTEFAWSKSVRKGNFRYVYYPKSMFRDQYPDGFGELYDLSRDPWEMKNLYFDKDYARVVQELRENLMDWLVTTTRPATIHPAFARTDAQTINRHHNSVNHDGKIDPRLIETMESRNYI